VAGIDRGALFRRMYCSDKIRDTSSDAERYKAGGSIEELARDYERKEEEIEEAVRCELQAAA
jgi:hypothetical protein